MLNRGCLYLHVIQLYACKIFFTVHRISQNFSGVSSHIAIKIAWVTFGSHTTGRHCASPLLIAKVHLQNFMSYLATISFFKIFHSYNFKLTGIVICSKNEVHLTHLIKCSKVFQENDCNIAMVSFCSSPQLHPSPIAYDKDAFLKAFARVCHTLQMCPGPI